MLRTMESIHTNKDVCEPDMDMSRSIVRISPSKVWRLLTSLLRSSTGDSSSIGKPRRSVDREQQQYAPIYD
jgi:hypothetical protein